MTESENEVEEVFEKLRSERMLEAWDTGSVFVTRMLSGTRSCNVPGFHDTRTTYYYTGLRVSKKM